MLSRLVVRAVDVALASALVASSVGLFRLDFLAAAAAALGLALLVVAASVRRSAWLRPSGEASRHSADTLVRHVRKPAATTLPSPYPDAWYAIALSPALPPGAVRSVTVCNRNLVVWRPLAGGPPVAMSAYCTHLGAHLGLGGGRVEARGIRCAFHGWVFDRDGACVHVPGLATCPAAAAIPKYACREVNGVIAIWLSSAAHRAGVEEAAAAAAALAPAPAAAAEAAAPVAVPGTVELAYEAPADGTAASAASAASARPRPPPSLAPWYDVPVMPELAVGSAWHWIGFTENIVPAIILEMPENGADVAHLPALHASFVVPGLGWALGHTWAATWTARTAAGSRHIADITVSQAVALFGVELPGKVDVTITQVGPSQVYLRMQTPVGPVFIIETVTPISPMEQRVLHSMYAPPWFPSIFAKAILSATMVQYEKDVPAWSNKRYVARPVLSAADKSIPAYRRWVTQFSNPDSVTYEEAAKQYVRDQLGLPAGASLTW